MNELVDLLERIENPGTFVVDGKLSSVPPGLKVKGLGLIALPFLEHQAQTLIQVSEQAPYGLGEETVLDTKVRNTWQISSENFSLTNPQWQQSLQKSVDKIGMQLGLHGCKINADPYKLLIYETGSFFSVHRDTEKVANMFATLVVNLPSEHEGGELVVSHGKQSKHFSFTNSDSFYPGFVAFYADCYHEVKPITSGYRICLIYNLSITDRLKQPRLSEQSKVIEELTDSIQQWRKKKTDNPILTYLLEHDYTEENLSIENLKNGDYAKAIALLEVAEKNNCQAFLCLASYYRSSYGEAGYYDKYSYDDDLDEDDFEEYDVDEEEVYAHCFITAKGDKVNITKLSLNEEDILSKIALLDGPGRDVSISEATGNEGATKELWYHRGAVIIWPSERSIDMTTKMDISYGIYFLQDFIKKHTPLDSAQRKKIIPLANHILDKQHPYSDQDIYPELLEIKDIELLKGYIHKRMDGYDSNIIRGEELIQILEQFGWQHFVEGIRTDLSSQYNVMEWIHSLLSAKVSVSHKGLEIIKKWFVDFWQSSLTRSVATKEISYVLQNASLLKSFALIPDILQFISTQKKGLFLTQHYGPAVIDAVNKLQDYDYDKSIIRQFIDDVLQQIEQDFPTPPEKPVDWSRKADLACDCQFCKQTGKFLLDPLQSKMTIDKTLKRNLLHIEDKVRKYHIDMDIEIRRTPPKFQGILKKNQNEYKNKCKLFKQAQDIKKSLKL